MDGKGDNVVTALAWLDPPQLGAWNMAMDQAMLEYAVSHRQTVLRVYEWSEPTISLGYFQDIGQREMYPALRSLACVRRVTGGGAILHDRELTYALAVPGDMDSKGHAGNLYRTVHRGVAAWLRDLGLDASLWEDLSPGLAKSHSTSTNESFFCFERRSDIDVVIGERKVFGSAQRRAIGGLLQHGSLLTESSPWYPNLRGLWSEPGENCTLQRKPRLVVKDLGDVLQRVLSDSLHCQWASGGAGEDVCRRATAIARERWASPKWTPLQNDRGD